MKNILTKLRNQLIGFFYRHLLKKILFKFDPEKIHKDAIKLGKTLGSNIFSKKIVSICLNYSNPMLKQNIKGLVFKNPVGLAAGFDKNAELIKIASDIGFGFIEVGSITSQPNAGNPKPRLWRLPESKGIVVYNGLENDGVRIIAERITRLTKKLERADRIPLGVSIAKTNSAETVETVKAINDYLEGIRSFLNIGDYLTINISCPNVFGGLAFTEPNLLNSLLSEISHLYILKPIFLKMSPDLLPEQIDEIIELAGHYRLSGFICSNATKNRNNPLINQKEINRLPMNKGGICGKALEEIANQMIAYIYQKTKGEKIIIGCGGVFSAQDAYKKIRLGASLIQLITGLIFEGPQVISDINLGLVKLLKKDGFKNISEAIGADFR